MDKAVDPDVAWGGDTKSRVYHELYLGMMKIFKDGKYEQAETLAAGYLEQADLPVHFRAHCYLIFACRADAWALENAQAAVDLLEKNRERAGDHFPHQLYAKAQFVLAEAKAEREEDIKAHNAREAAESNEEVGEEMEKHNPVRDAAQMKHVPAGSDGNTASPGGHSKK